MSSSSRGPRRNGRRHRPWYRKVKRGQVGFAVAGVLLVFAVMFAAQAVKASSALRLAASQTELLKTQIVSGDDVGAKATLTALQLSTEDAHDTTDGIMWDIGSHVPLLGRNVSAIQTVAAVVDQVALEALPPLVGLSEKVNLNAFSPRDGKIDLKTILEIRPSVIAAASALTARQRPGQDNQFGTRCWSRSGSRS